MQGKTKIRYHLTPIRMATIKKSIGVPTAAQWVKNLTATAWVHAEVWVLSLARQFPYAAHTAIKKKKKKDIQIITVGMEEKEPSNTVGSNINWYRQYGEQ